MPTICRTRHWSGIPAWAFMPSTSLPIGRRPNSTSNKDLREFGLKAEAESFLSFLRIGQMENGCSETKATDRDRSIISGHYLSRALSFRRSRPEFVGMQSQGATSTQHPETLKLMIMHHGVSRPEPDLSGINMTKPVATLILNRNLKDVTDRLVEHLQSGTVI